jgi:hypothetical protein
MKKSRSKRRQRMYNMRGCSKRRHIGGTSLAYTGSEMSLPPNPYLAYTGGDGGVSGDGVSNIQPNPGPPPPSTAGTVFSPANPQMGGTCSMCNAMSGGKRHRHRHRRNRTKKMRGGGLFPSDLVNVGRYIPYSMNSAYNAIMGYPQPVNPSPIVQPLITHK